MHMADALISPSVGIAMNIISIGALAYASAKTKKEELSEKKLPIMAVCGAFVFAAQMINFTIPATGSSGHLGGGILLAALLGGFPAFLTLAAVLFIQCLFFADGGLLALGCNIFNMAAIPCLIIYPLVFKPLTKKVFTQKNIAFASIISVVIGLQLGAFSVVLESLMSGITVLAFDKFVLLMQPIHLAIGLVEGIVTGAVLVFVYKMRPEIMESTRNRTIIAPAISIKKVLIIFCAITVFTGGALSLFASAYPDGLEWAVENTVGTAELQQSGQLAKTAADIQANTAFMPDYGFKDSENAPIGTAASGIIGAVITFSLAGAIGFIIKIAKSKKKRQ